MVQKARSQSDNLESLLREKQIEIEACKKEIEMERMQKDHVEKRVSEVIAYESYFVWIIFFNRVFSHVLFFKLLERCRNIDVEDYDRMKDDLQQMQVS